MADNVLTIAGTTIARHGYAVLIRGKSGAGKSDLALRAISSPVVLAGEVTAAPFQLVSDDQTVLRRCADSIAASPPNALAGLLEVRGIGIVETGHAKDAQLVLIVDLTDQHIDRMPEYPDQSQLILGMAIDRIELAGFEASATAKLALALDRSIKRVRDAKQAG